ncbi:unnamed protein product [Rotaria sordida]|uniref:CRC domain-containing protein n=1 Tax=Rotaria sordida TaxID=392033 RepID=A0A813XCR6_9BILA|nr:unnamed protein product [Rotaria sordida]
MWFDEDQQTKSNDRVIEENSSDEETEKCTCHKGCSTRSCSCFKNGSGCNSSCGCNGTCRNMFNHLEYFFGNDKKYSAHPCFAQWLKKTVKNADALQMIDREKLRQRIIKSENYPEMFGDYDNSKEWKKKNENEKLLDTQSLFRNLMSDEATDLYYSFCQDDVCDSDNDWHCAICRRCMDWRVWHCDKCNKCSWGSTLPCERCGDSNSDSELSDYF